jgi:hypothetical protein
MLANLGFLPVKIGVAINLASKPAGFPAETLSSIPA